MFYKTLLRPILFRFDAERAHEFAIQRSAWLSRQEWLTDRLRAFVAPRDDIISVAGMTFPNRVGLAGGMDKNGVAPRAWWAFGFGFIELGTVTPRPQAGNAKPRMLRFPKERSVLNRMGFNNDGAEAVAVRLADQANKRLRPPIPIGISLGKNKDTLPDDAADDYAKAATLLSPHANFLTINVSSPNTLGLRTFQAPESLKPLIRAVKGVAPAKPLFVKLAPELTGDPLAGIVDCCLSEGCAGIIATNTLAQFDERGNPIGGLSGRPLKEISPKRVEEIRKLMGERHALIGCGGIDDVPSARRMIAAGADLIQIYTALVYEGPFVAARLARVL